LTKKRTGQKSPSWGHPNVYENSLATEDDPGEANPGKKGMGRVSRVKFKCREGSATQFKALARGRNMAKENSSGKGRTEWKNDMRAAGQGGMFALLRGDAAG